MNAHFERVARMFEDDSTTDPLADNPAPTAADSPAGDEPVYAFEGYAVDFNDKVALLPLQALQALQAPQPSQATPRASRGAQR
jgi:hypothetical protein